MPMADADIVEAISGIQRNPQWMIATRHHLAVLRDLQAARAEIARLREALEWLLVGLDEYWVTTPDGQQSVKAAKAALAAKETP